MAQGTTVITNLPAWQASIGRFTQGVMTRVLQAQKKLAFDVLRGIVQKNPVRTGRSRAGWFVSVGDAPRTDTSPPRQQAYPNASAVISRGENGIARTQPSQATWIYNNVEYIRRLEFDFFSRQAPQGMVRVTLSEVGGEETFSRALTQIIQQEWSKP